MTVGHRVQKLDWRDRKERWFFVGLILNLGELFLGIQLVDISSLVRTPKNSSSAIENGCGKLWVDFSSRTLKINKEEFYLEEERDKELVSYPVRIENKKFYSSEILRDGESLDFLISGV